MKTRTTDDTLPLQELRTTQGKRKWIVGLRWVNHDLSLRKQRPAVGAATHRLTLRAGKKRTTGWGRPGRTGRWGVYSLAAAFLLRAGGNSYGIYCLDPAHDSCLFLATVGGLPSVMGDITGSLEAVKAAQQRFLDFNEPATGDGWACVSQPEAPAVWEEMLNGLSRSQLRQARLRPRTGRGLTGSVLLLVLAAAGGWYWHMQEQQVQEAALAQRQAMAQALLKARTEQRTAAELPHPWASLRPTSHFLSQCFFLRQPLPVSIAGWRLSLGECRKDRLQLRYDATPGTSVADFAQRAKTLLGREASFNLLEGGKTGDITLPLISGDNAQAWRDEALPPAGVQLMRFISYFQRRNLSVPLSEVKPSLPAPGTAEQAPVQSWREFTFTISSQLAPEWLFTGLDDTGVRVTSIAFTLSPQSQFDYVIKGSLYAQK